MVVLGGLVVVVVLVLVVVVVPGADVVEVVVVGEPGAVVVVVEVVVERCVGAFVLIVLKFACACSRYQEADAGPGESMGVTNRVAVTAAAEAPAKSAVARLPRSFSNTIPLVPPRFAAPPRCHAACGVRVRGDTQRIQVL